MSTAGIHPSATAEPEQDAASRRRGAEPLVDLSKIDLGAMAITRDQIKQYIPHRGVMLQLDGVIWHADDFTCAVAIRHVRENEFWHDGHIPGRPIMPGVLLVEAGAQVASVMYSARVKMDKFAGFTRIENTVFRSLVVPGDTLYLVSREVKFSPRRFVADIQGIVNDKIVFESRVTGMLF